MLSDISEVLYELRSRHGLSQEEVAEALNVSRVTYTRYENGTHKPDAYAAVKLSHMYGVPVEYILCMDMPDMDEDFEASLLASARHLNADGRKQLIKQLNYLLTDKDYTKEQSRSAM